MQNMARYGRNGDTAMAHLTPGETVVPQQVLQQNPNVARGLGRAFQDVGADPRRYVVGSGSNSINPTTGKPEFFMGFIGSLLSNPMVQGALGNLALRKIQGKDFGLRDALLGGLGGGAISAFGGGTTGMGGLDSLLGLDVDKGTNLLSGLMGKGSGSGATASGSIGEGLRGGATDALQSVVNKNVGSDIARSEGLLGIGKMFGTDPSKGGFLANALDTKIGESLAMGLGTQLLDSLFSKDEDPDPYGMMERFNRGAGQAPVKLRPREKRNRDEDYLLMRNKGGPAYFPRRNGGIMPSEGSGTKDDVPAMLTAGEFVMTRDAVKGAGNGNLNSGINKMYGMMDNLERKA